MPALRKPADSWTSRQHNQLPANVRHIAEKDNQVADALSRITIDAVELAQGVDFHAMALAQDSEDNIIHLRNDPAMALRLDNVRLNSTTSLLCDTSTGVQRPAVPVLFRMPSMDSRILEFARHDVFSHRSSSGLVSLQMRQLFNMLKISNEYDVHRRSMTDTYFHQRLPTFISGAQRRVTRWQTSAQTLWCDSTLGSAAASPLPKVSPGVLLSACCPHLLIVDLGVLQS